MRRIKLNNPILPVLAGILVFLKVVSPYRGWTVMLVFLGSLWLFSYLWAKSLADGLQLRREMRYGWTQVGDQLNERFTVSNHGWAPALWAEIVDYSTLPGYQVNRVTVVGGAGDEKQWQVKGTCSRRGVFSLGPTCLRAADPFGVYSAEVDFRDSVSLTVTPPILPLPLVQVTPAGRAGDGRSQRNAIERSFGTAGLREYLPGDSLRRIHWPTSAHQGSLFVRLFEGTSSSDWWIFLNLEGRVHFGLGAESSLELGIILAASLADTGLREGNRVGLVMSGEETTWIPARSEMDQRRRILQALAAARSGNYPIEDLLALSRYRHHLPSLILITPPADNSWIGSLVPLLRQGASVTVLLIDPSSFGSVDGVASVTSMLARLGVNFYLVGRDLLDRPEARPGRWGKWEWKVGASGRALPVRHPRDRVWKQLD